MRTLRHAVAAALALAAHAASAQLSNQSVALESGLSAPLPGGDPRPSFAVSVSAWIDGDVEAVARVALGSAAETPGRGAASLVSGTVGLRLSLLPDPLRPQLQVEIGWARAAGDGAPVDGLVVAFGAGLEWFAARDVSVAVRGAVRGPTGALAAEATAGIAAYF